MHAYLLEPFFAQALGLFYGIDKTPGVVTIIGVIAVACATILINKGTYAAINEGSRTLPALQEEGAGAAASGGNELPLSGSGDVEELSHLEMLQNKVKAMK